MTPVMITSTANPRVKALVRLRNRRDRDARGLFVIEGVTAVRRASDAGWPLVEVHVAPALLTAAASAVLVGLDPGLEVVELGEEAFRKVAYRRNPEGILAVGRSVPLGLARLTLPADPLVLVLEAIEKPGNLGAALRTADAAGFDAVVAANPATDPFNPNVVRASQGALFTVPLAVATAESALAWLTSHNVAVIAARPDAGAAPWDLDLRGGVAIVVGSEHAGLSSVWAGPRDVTIPMAGTVDSLNAATAAAILAYEARRQRS